MSYRTPSRNGDGRDSGIVGDAVNDRHNNAWVVVVMDRMRPVVGMLFVVLSVAAWGLLMWAVRQTLMAGYVADAVARGGG